MFKRIIRSLLFQELYDHMCALRRETREILMAQVFRDSIVDVSWVKQHNFSPHGAAANYSFLYILFKTLDLVAPKNILELGMGQTSKITSQYILHKNAIAQLVLVDHDQAWIDVFKSEITDSERISIEHCLTEEFVYKNYVTQCYQGLQDRLYDRKFDLIISDGPLGSNHYSRIDSIRLLKQNLADQFVIIIDDYDRKGEIETANEVMNELKILQKPYEFTVYSGTKKQCIIYSPSYRFLKTI